MDSKCEPRLLKGKIVQISSGAKFTQFVTDQGELFARGKSFLDALLLPVLKTATLIPFPDNIIVKKAYCSLGSQKSPVGMIEVIDKSELDNIIL